MVLKKVAEYIPLHIGLLVLSGRHLLTVDANNQKPRYRKQATVIPSSITLGWPAALRPSSLRPLPKLQHKLTDPAPRVLAQVPA